MLLQNVSVLWTNVPSVREIRKDIEQLEKEEDTDDAGTTNFLEDMIEKKEKTAWMIRAYLEK